MIRSTLLSLAVILGALAGTQGATATPAYTQSDPVGYINPVTQVLYLAAIGTTTDRQAVAMVDAFDADLVEDRFAGSLYVRDTTRLTDQEATADGLDAAVVFGVVSPAVGPGLYVIIALDGRIYYFLGLGEALDVDHFATWTHGVVSAGTLLTPVGFQRADE